ncbi:MAG: ABC transporter ATP-binding protein [Candidatus Hodarchaeales archaeon]|jgi:ABC-type lipoprotein export system ATPase subunit
MENILEVANLYKSYGVKEAKIEILRGINLFVKKGERVAIMGPSGSGKTTLLNVISGLDDVDLGEISINEKNIVKMSSDQRARFRRKYLGFIFQNSNLISSLSVQENVIFPLLLNKFGIKEAKSRVIDFLERIGLEDRANYSVSKLSGGEKQRIALARAMISRPSLILADEPTGNLDRNTARKIVKLIDEMTKEYNQTLLVVTHDPSVADVCDIVYFLNGTLRLNGEKDLPDI